MSHLNDTIQLTASIGFVAALAITGLQTHAAIGPIVLDQNPINGAMQSAYEDSFVQSNPLNPLAISAMGAIKYTVFGQAETGAIIGKNGWLFTAEEFATSPAFVQNLNRSANEISRVHTLLQDSGITLVPVIVPDKSEVYADMLRAERPVKIAARRADLLALLSARNVPALDATQALKSAKDAGAAFIKDDTHWTPLGSRAVAQMIAAHPKLANITLEHATVTTRQGSPVAYDGDLLKFVATGALRAAFGPDQGQIATYTTTIETNGGLFGDPTFDVALVGTSFSAKLEWNFVGFLQDAFQADVLSFATQGEGPFAPMRSYLASDAFANTPPKIVVWEIPARYTTMDMTK